MVANRGLADATEPIKYLKRFQICRVSSAVEQRFCNVFGRLTASHRSSPLPLSVNGLLTSAHPLLTAKTRSSLMVGGQFGGQIPVR
jgi:hypothetical protein